MSTLSQIQTLSNERQALYRKAGNSQGMSNRDYNRLYEINIQLRKLWQAHTDCANPWCACRLNGPYDGPTRPNTNNHNRGTIKLNSLAR